MGNTHHKDEAEMDYGHDSNVNVLDAECEAQMKASQGQTVAQHRTEVEAELEALQVVAS